MVDWSFLLQSLQARGFPQFWLDCIQHRVLQGSSRIILNSVAGKSIFLKRGVRQGDPISPYLYNLAMDFIIRWTQKLSDHGFLLPPFPQCRNCLLYADDTLLFLKPTTEQISRAGLVFQIFGQLSGLKINLSKSELTVTSSTPFLTQSLAQLLQCKPASFLTTYLGLPLSNKSVTKTDYLLLIDKIQAKLSGWKASLLSIGGRVVLVNAVLSAIPLYFISVFLLPKWVINKIDQIRRQFLWHGHREQRNQRKGLYMVSWAVATRPKELGGLGIKDLRIMNLALLAKWMWQWQTQQHAWWKNITPTAHENGRPWSSSLTSPFWKSMIQIVPVLSCSSKYKVGNGENTVFWRDNWNDTPLQFQYPNLFLAAQHKEASIKHCSAITGWVSHPPILTSVAQTEKNQLLIQLQNYCLNQQQDQLEWIRDKAGFSVKSFYKFLSYTPSPTSIIKNIWKIKAPTRILIFAWLLLSNRLTTTDNLIKRGWQISNMCVMCRVNEETAQHLFQTCSLAAEVRNYIYTQFGHAYNLPASFSAAHSFNILTDATENKAAKQWEIVTCFVLWKERCRRNFSDSASQHISLVREIKLQYIDWFV